MGWINEPLTLSGQTVELRSLDPSYFPELTALAAEKEIWKHYIFDGSDPDTFGNVLQGALMERKKGNQFPFVIFHRRDDCVIGSTRFLDLQPLHLKLEIGSTWLHPRYWGTAVNLECKLLLLSYCFEILHAVRVQLKTDALNIRSRRAIEKIGGQFEGIIRNDMIRENKTHRDSALYGLVNTDWKDSKARLEHLLNGKII